MSTASEPVARGMWRAVSGMYLSFLYAIGVLHWFFFFWFARFKALDWLLERRYHAILREALTEGKIPYLMTYAGHYSDRFLALPETPLSPQYLLLPLLNDAKFFYINAALMYTIGFAGLLWVRREYRLSALPFTFLFLLFHFNGYLVAHIAVGHLMWYGYYFLPCFYVLTIRLLDRATYGLTAIALIFLLFGMMLQGSFHVFVWCMMFLGLTLVFNPEHWRRLLAVLAGALAVNLYRLLPGVLALNLGQLELGGGYPSLSMLLDGLTLLQDFRYGGSVGTFGHTMPVYWWEFDCFVGMTGFGVLAYFGTRRWMHLGAMHPLAFPCATMFILSLGVTYSITSSLGLPFAQSQRLPTRFIVIPLTFLMLLASLEIEQFLRTPGRSAAWWTFLTLCAGLLTVELSQHSSLWRVSEIESSPVLLNMEKAVSVAIRAPAWETASFRFYVMAVWGSWAFSALVVVVLVALLIRIRRRGLA